MVSITRSRSFSCRQQAGHRLSFHGVNKPGLAGPAAKLDCLWARWMSNQTNWGVLAGTLLLAALTLPRVRDNTAGKQIKNPHTLCQQGRREREGSC